LEAPVPDWKRRFSLRPLRPAVVALFAAAAGVAALATGSLFIRAGQGPDLLLNGSPSEPPGLYLRAQGPARAGAIIAFRTPAAAFPYADRHMPYLHQRPLLKAVAAIAGDEVCTHGDTLAINGIARAAIQTRDQEGGVLPHWSGCRSLRADELFVFSARVPNSFDSRYYGPVNQRAVLGVYRFVGNL
jgi:conjugative transfer signal peptidase TraF